VAPIVGSGIFAFGASLESVGLFYVFEFGRNLDSVVVNVFAINLLYEEFL
jgi:hypothetical protein